MRVVLGFGLCLFWGLTGLGANDPNYNQWPESGTERATQTALSSGFDFDPNLYRFLVYDPKPNNSDIVPALDVIGITDYEYFTPSKPIAEPNFVESSILIVGWSQGGNMSGLDPDVLESVINRQVLLTGHDADWHTANDGNEENQQSAQRFLEQGIVHVLKNSVTGMFALTDVVDRFDWLPISWGVSANSISGELVESFTPEAVTSGVYDNLTPDLMSNWDTSYHSNLTAWGNEFVLFEEGAGNNITISGKFHKYGVTLTKTDGLTSGECYRIGQSFVYTLCIENLSNNAFEDVVLIDYLPIGVDYPPGEWSFDPNTLEIIPGDPGYDPTTHTFTWDIGTLQPTEPNVPICLSISVTVNDCAVPGDVLCNVADLYAGTTKLVRSSLRTPVCCDDPDQVIYVDSKALGCQSGTSWATAYNDLQDALQRARRGCGSEIWVAAGTYVPGEQTTDSFEIPDGVELYGGFLGIEAIRDQRDWKENETILSGRIDEATRNARIVIPGNLSLIDGFSIREGETGLFTQDRNISFNLHNNNISDNSQEGLSIRDADSYVYNCIISTNGIEGVRFQNDSVGHLLKVLNCRIYDNQREGVFVNFSQIEMKNSLLYGNGKGGDFPAVHLLNLSANSIIHNNTIANNNKEAIRQQSGSQPDVANCILWENNLADGLFQTEGISMTSYSCVHDPNDPNGVDTTVDIDGNISIYPIWAYDQSPFGFYHLDDDSPCKDAGDTALVGIGDTDMDGDNRIFSNVVDIGADEITCANTSHTCDTNFNGIINLREFQQLQRAWLSHDPNDPAVIADPNLYDPNDLARFNYRFDKDSDYDIDFDDLMLFTPDWLWRACWLPNFQQTLLLGNGAENMMMAFVSGSALSQMIPQASPITAGSELREMEQLLINLAMTRLEVDTIMIEQHSDVDQWREFQDNLSDFEAAMLEYYRELSTNP